MKRFFHKLAALLLCIVTSTIWLMGSMAPTLADDYIINAEVDIQLPDDLNNTKSSESITLDDSLEAFIELDDSNIAELEETALAVTDSDITISDDPGAQVATPQLNKNSDFEINEDGVLTGYHGPGGKVIIPSSVVEITSCFSGNTDITSVIIPKNVTIIGCGAFMNCANLVSVKVLNPDAHIGGSAFCYCDKLTSLTVPGECVGDAYAGLLSTGAENVTDLVITPGSKAISGGFGFCAYMENLKSVTIPNSVTLIGAGSFAYCKSLTSIDIPDTVTEIGRYAFECSGLKTINFPKKVTRIADEVCKECANLEKVTFSGKITEIGESAFWKCKRLKAITIPRSVDHICSYAFNYCTGLERLIIEGTPVMGDDTFEGCINVTYAELPGGNDYTNLKKLKQVVINPDDYLYGGFFGNLKKLTTVSLNEHIEFIPSEAFKGCSALKTVDLPASLYCIDDEVFMNCKSLKNIVIPDGTAYIGRDSFRNCTGLTNLVLPNSIKTIYNGAFKNCTGLSSITIPRDIESISDSAFNGCKNLKIIGYRGTLAETYASKHGIPFVDIERKSPKSISLNKTGTVSLKIGKKLSLKARLKPSNAVSYLTWKSSRPKVATVNSRGVVQAVGKGTTTITVQTNNGKIAKVKIKVIVP